MVRMECLKKESSGAVKAVKLRDMESTCRFCLGMDTKLVSVFSTLETSSEKICDLAAYTLNIFMDPDDKSPKNVCQFCIKSIVDFRTFKMRAHEAERSFRSFFDTQMKEEVAGIADGFVEDELMESQRDFSEQDDPEEKQEFSCSSCSKCFENKRELESHSVYHESINYVTTHCTFFTCHTCHTIFPKAEDLSQHLMTFADHTKTQDFFDSCVYSCGICKEDNEKIEELKVHVFQHLDKYICPILECVFEYKTFSRLMNHVQKKHVPKEQYECERCSKSFKDLTELRTHMRIRCTGRKFPCTHCDKTFFSQQSLAFHLKCANKNLICEVCGKGFGYRGDLKAHMRTHTNERPFKCKICGKAYKSASTRINHMEIHREGKNYPCSICGLRLKSKASLNGHMRRHREHKKHGCDICGRLFSSNYRLTVHKKGVHKILTIKKAKS